jgi:hypothetical protein
VKKGENVRCTKVVQLDIKLKPDAKPLKAKAYRTTPEMRKEINKQIDEMLKGDIIETCDGTYTSPVFLVPKQGGSFRLVVDYRS